MLYQGPPIHDMQTRRQSSMGFIRLSLCSRGSADYCRHMSTSAAPALGLPPLALGLPPLAVAYLVSWSRADLGMQGKDPCRSALQGLANNWAVWVLQSVQAAVLIQTQKLLDSC